MHVSLTLCGWVSLIIVNRQVKFCSLTFLTTDNNNAPFVFQCSISKRMDHHFGKVWRNNNRDKWSAWKTDVWWCVQFDRITLAYFSPTFLELHPLRETTKKPSSSWLFFFFFSFKKTSSRVTGVITGIKWFLDQERWFLITSSRLVPWNWFFFSRRCDGLELMD